jgi:intracellular sulfur oxidation DsrE/DsrF family protein
MKKDEHISEEQLNAFVDGELDSEERNSLFDATEKSKELDGRLCQQRKLKELVKHAYRDVPRARHRLPGPRTPKSLAGLALAASVLLAVGTLSGLLVHSYMDRSTEAQTFAATSTQQAVASSENYILHVTSGSAEQMKLALQRATTLLAAAEPGKPRKVEVVANDRGLNLLRSDITPFSTEIRALANQDVIFYACSKAIQRLEEKGVDVRLVPEAIVGYTALDRVVTRMKDGWQYIKI